MLRCLVCECHVVAPLARRASSSPLVCVASGYRLISGSLQRAAFTSVKTVCCGSAVTVQRASAARHHSTAAADTAAAASPRSSGFGKHATTASSSTSPNPRSAVLRHSSSASSPASLPPPPPLSILSWTVDGSGHSHHRCRRRLSMEQRIPLLCETIRRAAADVVALQDSTAELAAALTADAHTDVSDSQLKVYCLEQTRERRPQLRDTAAATDAGDGGQEEAQQQQQQQQSAAEKSELEHDHRSTPPSSDAVGAVAESQSSAASAGAQRSTYRLVGSARNGRCGEVQVFVKNGSAWSATLLPCLGAGVTVELTSHTTTNTATSRGGGNDENEDGGSAPTSDAGDAATISKDEASTASAATATAPSLSPLHPSSSSPRHTCVLTTADLSYRGKSLGTHLQGLLSDSTVSMDGSPFTLQTPMSATAAAAAPSLSSSPSSSPRRVAGQLDAHRAIAFEWVHHHVRPDILVGNFFTGARERVPGFDDAWVRAGSPAGQERTTNTCARHRVDRMTNYFYFCPSSGVASRTAVEKVLALEEEEGEGEQQRGDGFGEGQGSATVAVAADAAVGQPIPLDAQLDEADGTWYAPVRGKQLSDAKKARVGEERDCAAGTAAAAVSPALLSDLSAGMPEVAGRFQRCLFRSWVRRGASSRSGHLSAHPFLRQYRRCRVVVLRPMVEISLAAAERAWHTRYISAQYHLLTRRRAQLRAAPGGAGELSEQEGCAAGNGKEEEGAVQGGVDSRVEEECSERSESGEASDTEKASVVSLEELVRLPPRVRCSLSDQFPLVTILS